MSYKGLSDYIKRLDQEGELIRVDEFVSPELEISEITDRITKSNGKALLFANNGTKFPVLINAFGSQKRMALAIGRKDLNDAGNEIESLFNIMTSSGSKNLISKIKGLPQLLKLSKLLPHKRRGKGRCQQVVMKVPDLDIFPVLKCWPFDGGKFITLPAVHTYHPDTGRTNVGMYRMQLLDKTTTGMHWHRHKTGSNHFQAWKKRGLLMPVAVTLGGDPVFTYAATAPLPENIDEYILAGFLRKKRVEKVKCLTQNIWVPADADIVIEGYVDPSEKLVWEGPFGDHTGVYSLADWYPAFHVTAITHARDAVYPATIVGVPPQEDAWIGEATERIFLSPIKLTLAPEVVDLHMPVAGVAHNLVIVKINKTYPGQGMKVLSTLFGAGQMMFSKFIVVVSDNTDLRDYPGIIAQIQKNCNLNRDLMVLRGPLDVLDHSSDNFSLGGKMGIDATVKTEGELNNEPVYEMVQSNELEKTGDKIKERFPASIADFAVPCHGIIAITLAKNAPPISESILCESFNMSGTTIAILLEKGTPLNESDIIVWQVTGNTDPLRDVIIKDNLVIIDATFKITGKKGFQRKWPNVVTSAKQTIEEIDRRWSSLTDLGPIESPSSRISGMTRGNSAEIIL